MLLFEIHVIAAISELWNMLLFQIPVTATLPAGISLTTQDLQIIQQQLLQQVQQNQLQQQQVQQNQLQQQQVQNQV